MIDTMDEYESALGELVVMVAALNNDLRAAVAAIDRDDEPALLEALQQAEQRVRATVTALGRRRDRARDRVAELQEWSHDA